MREDKTAKDGKEEVGIQRQAEVFYFIYHLDYLRLVS